MVASALPGGKVIRPMPEHFLQPENSDSGGPSDAALLVHDVRNLLHLAHNQTEILESELKDPEQLKRLRYARQSLAFAASLCEDLLAAAASGRKAPFAEVDLGIVATSVTASFHAHFSDSVPVQFAGPGERVFVRGRATEIERAVLNLMWNALDAMQQADVAEPRLDLSWGRNARGAFFQVRDYGPGLPGGKLTDLTRPFHTSHSTTGKVRGLGLTAVQRILKEHDGILESGSAAAGPGAVMRLQFGVQRELEFGG
jgi:C4-dicarboxylate-specific signal transduction histidine kinase